MQPRNTLRIVLYQDEEINLSGLKEFARISKENTSPIFSTLRLTQEQETCRLLRFGRPRLFRKMEEVLTPIWNPVV